MTKTNLQLINFINYARSYGKVDNDGKPIANPPKTKWTYALERMDKRLTDQLETYHTALADLQIEHAATEKEGGPILVDERGNFRYTKDGLRARREAQKKLLAVEITFEPYYATEVPKDLSQAEKEVAAGFVLREEEAIPPPDEEPDPVA